MRRMPIELSQTERRERVALAATTGKSNRVIAAELGVDEATVRRDLKFLATPLEQRPVKKPEKVKPVRELSPDKMHDRRLKQLLELAQQWVLQEHLILPDIEHVLHEAGKLMHRDRALVMRLPDRPETPSELLVSAQPRRIPEDYMPDKLDYCVEWFARWLASCLPREEELRDEVLRSISKWARG